MIAMIANDSWDKLYDDIVDALYWSDVSDAPAACTYFSTDKECLIVYMNNGKTCTEECPMFYCKNCNETMAKNIINRAKALKDEDK